MLQIDRKIHRKSEGRLVAQWIPDGHGDAKQFVEVGPYFARPPMSHVTVAYSPPLPPVSNTTSGIASGNLFLHVKQQKNKKGDDVVGLTPHSSEATKFEFSALGGMKKGSNCFHLARASGMHPMGLDGDGEHVKSTPKCSQFLSDGLPYGNPGEWKMMVQGNNWCLAAPDDDGSLKAVKVGVGECSPHWQMSATGLGSGLDFENADDVGTCELFVQKNASVRSEEAATSAPCPNIDGTWNVPLRVAPVILKAKIQASGTVGTVTFETDVGHFDIRGIWHFVIEGDCHRIRVCTIEMRPDLCTMPGTFLEGTLDSAGNTITWDYDLLPQWKNAVPLHNKCPNMAYYACATGPVEKVDHQDFMCSFAPNYQVCEDHCKKQPGTECHFCSDGSCVRNTQYII